jgi:hypothetical protein
MNAEDLNSLIRMARLVYPDMKTFSLYRVDKPELMIEGRFVKLDKEHNGIRYTHLSKGFSTDLLVFCGG